MVLAIRNKILEIEGKKFKFSKIKSQFHARYNFDFDETLFRTKAKALVVKGQTVIKRLNNQEYNKHKLVSGEQFDYAEFSDATLLKKFILT